MNSIIQQDNDVCFLCGGGQGIEALDKHHIFSGALRKKSEKYGLTVYLHHSKCHIFGENSVHVNREIREKLCAYAQEKAMKFYNWTTEDFIQIFGRSWIE